MPHLNRFRLSKLTILCWMGINVPGFTHAFLLAAQESPATALPDQGPELIPQVSTSGIGSLPDVFFGASGAWLATTNKASVVIYDLKGGRISRRIGTASEELQIAPRPGTDSIAVMDGASISIYDVLTGKSLCRFDLARRCSGIHFSTDGSKLLGICDAPAGHGGVKQVVRRWNADTAGELPSTDLPADITIGKLFSEDGRWVLGTARPDENISGPLQTIRKTMRAMKAMSDHPIVDAETGAIIGRVNGYMVQALSHKSHSAIAMRVSMDAKFLLQLVDVPTGKVLQTYNGGSQMAYSKVSADGTHFLLPDGKGVSIVDAGNGDVQHPQWQGVPQLSNVALASDLDTVAFAQGGNIVLSQISRPTEVRTIGDPDQFAKTVAREQMQGLGVSGSGIQTTSTPTKAGTVAKAIAHEYFPGKTSRDNGGSTFDVKGTKEILKQCQLQAKHIKKETPRAQAVNACEAAAYEAKSKDSEARGEQSFYDSILKFGGPVLLPPIIVSLDEGRLLAIFCADYSWGLWDTATGNRLPYHKAFDFATTRSKESGATFFSDGLHEIEQEFGVRQVTDFMFATKPREEEKTASPDGEQYYTYFSHPHAFTQSDTNDRLTKDAGIHVWDSASNKPSYDLPEVLTGMALPVVAPGGKTLLGADRDNTLGIWVRSTGQRIGTLYALQEGEWLLTTPSGLFDGSPRGWSKIAWRDPHGGISTLPSEAFFNEFYRPGLLAELLDGRPPQPPRMIADVDRRQPTVQLTTDAPATSIRSATLHLSLAEAGANSPAQNPGGIKDVRLFRNGTLVQVWRGDVALQHGQAQFDATVQLAAGDNRFVAYAFNRDNVKSADATVSVLCSAPARQGTAYIVAVGVNEYSNPEFNLKFALPDAQHLTQLLEDRQQSLGVYRQVVTAQLLNRDATKSNIQLALAILGGRVPSSVAAQAIPQIAALRAAEPEDTVILYFAGHGLAWGDRFYLIPHDLGYGGPRDQLRDSLDQVLKRSISDLELEQAFESINSAHILLIIDACNSGKVLDANEQRRGPMNSRGLAQLAYEKGMYVLTASQAFEAALESSRLGYGYLTFALAKEGLETPVADTRPVDGQVSVVEWFEYASRRVPQLQSEALNQTPANGRTLTFEQTTDAHSSVSSRLQTPRLYYRRDQPGDDAIVYKIH